MDSIYRVSFESTQYVQKAVQSALAINRCPHELHNQFIQIYWRMYQELGHQIHLELGLEHVTAYIRAGFDYRSLETAALEVVKKAGYISLEDYIHTTFGDRPTRYDVELTRNRIDQILGRGSASKIRNGITKKTIIDEIMTKIANREEGTYCYKVESKGEVNLSYLIIDESGVFMQDNHGNEYRFIDV